MVLGVQIVGMLFGVFLLYLTFLHRKKKEFTAREYVFWSFIWIVLIGVSLMPTALDFFVKRLLQIDRRLDFFIITGFLFLTAVIFYTYGIVRRNQQKIEDIVRQVAIKRK